MENCKRLNCSGKIEDGYCTECGMAPVGSIAPAVVVSNYSTPSARAAIASGTASVGTRGSTGRALGAGFVTLAPQPSLDPLQSILQAPVVPEHRRFCGSCQKKVTRESGFCPHCGKSYAFEPALKAGDVVGGQYEVRGPLAFGGLGWIYLAQDARLQQRWVVLKGLLNSKDDNAARAALQEREFLSAVKHPNIVSVYNFVNHGADGFIVMEYVGGKTLNQLRKERGPLPPAEAIAYIHRTLSAFAYLHERGLVYCDLKPANVMVDDDVKLIDLGGVRQMNFVNGEVFGTKGFFAPEIGDGEAPSVASDLYTVARTLAVLLLNFDFQHTHEYSLPTAQEEPLFQKYDSLHRFLSRALHKKANRRFQSADEMAGQLLGVLRDVVSASAQPRLVESQIFGPDPLDPHADFEAVSSPRGMELPALKLDADDPAAHAILACGLNDPQRRIAYLERVAAQFPHSPEAHFRLADAYLATRDIDKAKELLKQDTIQGVHDWRVRWYRGRLWLLQNTPAEAFNEFNAVYTDLPGELGAKLAFALTSERAMAMHQAAAAYDLVSRCDPSYVSATFGLARCCLAMGDRRGAVTAYERVPETSSFHQLAQIAAIHVLLDRTAGAYHSDLLKASERLCALQLDGFRLHDLRAKVLLYGVECLDSGALQPASQFEVLGEPFDAGRLRFALEKELRMCARYAATRELKILFVDRANELRPRTLV